jgi:CRISPR-associated endonuclease/helicase Cas3
MANKKPFQLYPFQRRVYDTIVKDGRNVILQAPTGSGKTRAALSPFVDNLSKEGDALPLTCRYAVPQRVLANQFLREHEFLTDKIDKSASSETRLGDVYRQIGRKAVAIQTGEQPEDAQLEAALTFCTIDQLLASFLGIPYGLGLKRANLNVAGVLGSYLVLDEFHLYPLRDGKSIFGARTTALQMLRLLKATTPFVLMTATFSTSLLQRLETLLDAKVISVTDEAELQEIAQGRTRTFWRSETGMDAEEILREHRQRSTNKCTLVVCNTVGRAQLLYRQLTQLETEGTDIVLLHSRFTPTDRRAISLGIEHELGPDNWQDGHYQGHDLLVVATQVVEVGLDISVQVLHTEIAPASSLIQRAGRCARFAQQQGEVRVYPLELNEDGSTASTLPYNKDLCSLTWQALEQFHGQVVGFAQEQVLIDAVHTQEDTALLDEYAMYEDQVLEKIFTSLQTNDRAFASSLIRDVAQVQILIHDDPNQAIQETPWQWESFGMHPGSLMSNTRWQALQERAANAERDIPVCWEAEPLVQEQKDGEDLDNREKTIYKWKPVASPNTIPQALMLAFPHELAHYDSKLGFVLLDDQLAQELGTPSAYQSKRLSALIPRYENYGSKQQSYQEHIAGLVRAYNFRIRKEILYAVTRLERAMGLDAGVIEQAISLAIACHDLGKLNQSWQAWALEWQQLVYQKRHELLYQIPHAGYCFAKTDYTWREQREWQKYIKAKRPHHACESVVLGRKLIGSSLGIAPGTRQEYLPVLRAVCGAIARHHTAQASEYHAARLLPSAIQAATEALAATHNVQDQRETWSYDPAHLLRQIVSGGDLDPIEAEKPKLTRPGNTTQQAELETWLYFLIVRTLRLSDQRAE